MRIRPLQDLKEHLITIDLLLGRRKDLDQQKRLELIKLILSDGDKQQAETVLAVPENTRKRKGWWLVSAFRSFFSEGDGFGEHMFREARKVTAGMADIQFLLTLKDIDAREPLLREVVVETENIARDEIKKVISKLLKKILHKALHIQQEDCKKHYQLLLASREEEDQRGSRIHLIREIKEKSESAASS
jgi:hypothetical protein